MTKRKIDMTKFTESQKDAIERFLDEMLKISRNTLDTFRGQQDAPNSTLIAGMRNYWKHVEAAYKFAHSQNKPRKRKMDHASSRTHQPSEIVNEGRSCNETGERV